MCCKTLILFITLSTNNIFIKQETLSQRIQQHNNPWISTSTTPWPSLGGRKQNNVTDVTYTQPVWVRPTGPRPSSTTTTSKSPNSRGKIPETETFITNERVQPNAWNQNNPLKFGPQTLKPLTPVRFMTSTPKMDPKSNQKNQMNQEEITNRNSNDAKMREDNELRDFSEKLLTKDTNNAFKYIKADYQGKTRSSSLRDEAPDRLLTIQDGAFSIPTIRKLSALYNNYIVQSDQNEVYTPQEKIEENDFLESILSTNVMQHTRNFLISKDKIPKDPQKFKEVLRRIWFNMYSRGGGKIGSSGFEHVFLTEIKNNSVSGLHNWLYFNEEEKKNEANYLGYLKVLEFDKGAILKHHFNFQSLDKPVGTMFIGTSPEFEMALYSTCFLIRPNEICPLRLGGRNFVIRTYAYRYRGQSMIGSAFPEI